MSCNTAKITMIEGAQKSVLFQFPDVVNVSLYQFIFEIRSSVSKSLVFRFSTEDGTLQKSENNVLLFIPASLTRGKPGQYDSQIGCFTEPDDLTKFDPIDFIIEKAVLEDETPPNGDSVFDLVNAQQVEIQVNEPPVIELTPTEFAIFNSIVAGLNYEIMSFGTPSLSKGIAVYATPETLTPDTANVIVTDILGQKRAYIFKITENATVRFIKGIPDGGGGETYEDVLVLEEPGVYLVRFQEDETIVSDELGGSGVIGANGWTPVFKTEADGADRLVLKIDSWAGGAGTMPATGYFKTDGTLTANIAEAANFKGDQGEQGIQGIPGEQGEPGEQGIQGEPGEQGEQGIQGIPGEKGDKGDKGDPGDSLAPEEAAKTVFYKEYDFVTGTEGTDFVVVQDGSVWVSGSEAYVLGQFGVLGLNAGSVNSRIAPMTYNSIMSFGDGAVLMRFSGLRFSSIGSGEGYKFLIGIMNSGSTLVQYESMHLEYNSETGVVDYVVFWEGAELLREEVFTALPDTLYNIEVAINAASTGAVISWSTGMTLPYDNTHTITGSYSITPSIYRLSGYGMLLFKTLGSSGTAKVSLDRFIFKKTFTTPRP